MGAAAGGGGGPGPLLPRGALGDDSAFDHECDDDDDAHEGEGEQDAAQGETQQELVEQERRRAEDLDVGRPRAPEPSLFGMGIGLGMGMRERRSTGSPLSASTSGAEAKAVPVQAASTSLTTTASAPTCVTTEDVHAQVERLAAQVGVVALRVGTRTSLRGGYASTITHKHAFLPALCTRRPGAPRGLTQMISSESHIIRRTPTLSEQIMIRCSRVRVVGRREEIDGWAR